MSKIFGGDGYREIEAKEQSMRKNSSTNFLFQKRKTSEKKLNEQLKKEAKLKVKSQRSAKLFHPKGAGKRNA